jgi:hypothetical protein
VASDRPNQTAVDYVTIVLSPVLVMGLVGSLAFFLLEVFYKTDGPWRDRLQYILFCFVFGMVLVARISMNGEIASRAPLYGAILGFVTYLGMQSFIEYPPGVRELSFLVNLIVIAVVWWCTNRLVWDCTNVDEETDMSGEGLLQASGIEEKTEPKPRLGDDDPELLEEDKGGAQGWFERYRKYREKKNKKRTLGVWVVYFSMAALPIFGLGQSLIPLTAPERRQFSFWLMTVYIGCGLGLLLTTCFLGLRRYLRQKRLQMPAAMTGAWMAMGGTLLVALLLVGALLPRPAAEYSPLSDLIDPAGSAKRKASRYAAKGDSPGEGEGKPGQGGKDGKQGNASGKDSKDGGGKDKDGKGQGKGDGKDGDGKDGKGQSGGDKQGEKNQGGGDQKKGDGDKQGEKGKSGDKQQGGRQADAAKAAKGMQEMEKQASSSPSSPTNAMQQVLAKVGPVLKWIVFAVMVFVVVVALLRGGLGFLANFTDWAKNLLKTWQDFWANLFGQKKAEQADDGEDEPEREADRSVPFSSFGNPFDDGSAARMSPRKLVRYTFRAVEAWARERDLGREDGETAMEFLQRVGDEVPALEAEARRLTELHARAEYGPGGPPASTPDQLRVFWEKLERVAAAPLSA